MCFVMSFNAKIGGLAVSRPNMKKTKIVVSSPPQPPPPPTFLEKKGSEMELP